MEPLPTRKRSASETHDSPVNRLLRKALASPVPAAPTPDRVEGGSHAFDEDEDEELLQSLPSDFMAAIRFLRSQIPATLGLPPVFLRSQLSSMLTDKACIERELDQLRRDNVIRMFRLSTGPDEFAILLTEDYVHTIKQAASAGAAASARRSNPQASSSSSSDSAQLRLVDAFCTRVLACHTDLTITRAHLLHLLAAPAGGPKLPMRTPGGGSPGNAVVTQPTASATAAAAAAAARALPASLPCPDTQVSLLMQAGVLSRDPGDDATYWLCVPGLGKVALAISAGRQELSAVLARRKYHEVPEQLLLAKTKLRRSPLDIAFHLRDMLGLGVVQRVSITSGSIIRLVRR